MQSSSAPFSHIDDPRRLAALESTQLLDTQAEEAFDRLTRLAAQLLGTPAAQINLVDTRRQFFKSDYQSHGRSNGGGEVPLAESFCQYVVADQRPLIIEDARTQPLVCSHGVVLSGTVIAYLGVPLTTSDGYTLGSLCAFDSVPRTWPVEHVAVLQELAAFTITEIELRRTAKRLQENYAQLQKLELHRGELVDMLVHDLRNPLTSIVGGLELISGTPGLTETTREDVELARSGMHELIQIVNEILDVSKMEAGHPGLSLTDSTPDEVVDCAVRRVQHLAITQGLTLRTASEGGTSALQADASKLCRVLVNLTANAIQHSPPGSDILIATVVDDARAEVTFRVHDRGVGIAPDVLPRLFEKFHTGDRRRNGHASTGLGLSFCKMAVEAHGGTIRVESTGQAGTVFAVTVPTTQPG